MEVVMTNTWLAHKSSNNAPLRHRSSRPFLQIQPLQVSLSSPTCIEVLPPASHLTPMPIPWVVNPHGSNTMLFFQAEPNHAPWLQAWLQDDQQAPLPGLVSLIQARYSDSKLVVSFGMTTRSRFATLMWWRGLCGPMILGAVLSAPVRVSQVKLVQRYGPD